MVITCRRLDILLFLILFWAVFHQETLMGIWVLSYISQLLAQTAQQFSSSFEAKTRQLSLQIELRAEKTSRSEFMLLEPK